MADEEKQEAEDEPKATEGEESSEEGGEDKPKKDRGPLKLLGGVIGLIAAGGVLAFMALPSKPGPPPRFTGPYHHSLFEAEFEDSSFAYRPGRSVDLVASQRYRVLDDPALREQLADWLGA